MPRKHDHNGSKDCNAKANMTPSKPRGSRGSTSSSLQGFGGFSDILMDQANHDEDEDMMSSSRMAIDGEGVGEEEEEDDEIDLSRPSGHRYRRRQSRGLGLNEENVFLYEDRRDEDEDEGDEVHEERDDSEERGDDDDEEDEEEEDRHHDDDDDDEEDHDNEDEEEEEEMHSSNDEEGNESASNRIRNVFGALSAGLMMSGFSSRVRPILDAIKNREDQSAVLMGLQELADNLLISTEDILIGYFPLDEFVHELVRIMRDPLYEDSPEIMLMACRDIANLIEVLPSSVGSIVQTDCIQVLCQKLLEIQYIDLAEQALAVSGIPSEARNNGSGQSPAAGGKTKTNEKP